MIIDNLKNDFYDTIASERILVVVSLDVDAICACKIVKHLFQHDNTQYTIVPASGIEDLKNIYDEHKEQVKYYLLINCGANLDLEILEADEESVFYIADSHRPLDLSNVFNEQTRLLVKEGDPTLEDIPDPEKVIENEDDEDDDDDDSEDDPDEPSSKRQKTGEDGVSVLEKRVKKKKWAQERDRIIDDYYECSYYGSSEKGNSQDVDVKNQVSLVLFDLAWKLSKDSNDLLWYSIIGLTDQYLSSKIDHTKYFDDCNTLRDHVMRHNVVDEDNDRSIDCLKITFEQELRLVMYRHWSLFESFFCTQYTSCSFRLFTMKGKKKLHEMFADMGLPIVQCKQKFQAMDIDLRGNVKEWIQNIAPKYGLEDLTFGSFTGQFGYRTKLCASDVVYSINALLEFSLYLQDIGLIPTTFYTFIMNHKDFLTRMLKREASLLNILEFEQKNVAFHRKKVLSKDVSVKIQKDGHNYSDHFLDAMDALTRSNTEKLTDGIELAKTQIQTMVDQVRSFIDSHQIVCAGPYLYVHVQDGSPTAHLFAHPSMIRKLARFSLEAYSVMTKNKKARSLPFVLAVPYNTEEGTSLLVGVPPVSDTSFKSFFGAAFRQAGEKTKSRIKYDFFDPTIIEINTEDRSKFFDNLSALMA